MSEQGTPVGTARSRTTAEWVTLAASALVVFSVLGLLIVDLIVGSSRDPVIRVDACFDAIYEEGEKYYLPTTIINEGGRTAADVSVHFVLHPGGEAPAESSTFTLRFLAPGEQAEAVIIFNAEPRPETLRFSSSYLYP